MDFNAASILTLFIGLVLGGGTIYAIIILTGAGAGKKAEKIINDAKKEADKAKRDSILELKEESFKLKQETDREVKEKKAEIQSSEERLLQREKSLDKREELLQNRDNLLEIKDNNLTAAGKALQEKELKMDELLKEEMEKLEKIANFSREKAHDMIMERVETSMAREIAEFIKDKEAEAKLEVDKKAKNLLVNSMEKYANDVTTIQTVSTIDLPNDEMKGRLIGREGRNIRTIEAVTGVDLIIDDTPEAIVISSFDPFRREIAKQAIETLIKDGRIHPTRIEEIYDKTCRDMNARVTEIGNEAVYELGLTKIDPELVNLIGKLNFRTSYGQNALQHSKEVAYLSGIIAGELGENVTLARRAGLLHDIGKALDFEMEGTHVQLGAEICRKYKESPVVINSIESHHGDVEPDNLISLLVECADMISAARPGARREDIDVYINRLKRLEEISNAHEEVVESYAVQAGREIRVMVSPEKIDDVRMELLAKDIADQIETELAYPGQIRVSVIRESRVVEYAK